MAKNLLISVLLMLIVGFIKSQPYYFTHYQVEHGLSNNAVLCSFQDKNGFMWFGTRDGLNRFDGYTFKTFQSDFNSHSILESNYIRALKEDTKGKIWVGTDQGLYIFDPLIEKFTLFHPDYKDEILDIQEDKNNNIWFINDMKLYKYITGEDSVIHITKNLNISSFSFSPDEQKIWAGTTEGNIIQYSLKGRRLATFSVFKNSSPSADKWIEKILSTHENKLMIGTRKQGIKIFDIKTKTYQDLLQTDLKDEAIFVRDILHHKGNKYWFATESGIIIYDLEDDNYKFIVKERDNNWSLSDNAVYTLCKDAEGAIWAGTYFGGINYYSETNVFFEKFYPRNGANSITGYAVREMVEDQKGNLWIGTEDNGLSKYNPEENIFTNFTPSAKPGSIAHSNIHGLLITGDTLWIGTFEHGLDLMNTNSGKVIKHYNASTKSGSLGNNFIFNILKTRNNQILLATGKGLYEYRSLSKDFFLSDYMPNHIFYTTLFEDDTGTIWAGTWRDGVYYYNPKSGERGKFTHDAANPKSLSSNRVNRVFQDHDKDLWIATEGGLSKLDSSSKEFIHYTTRQGLPSNLILSVLEDQQGFLWISTSKGIVRFDKDTNALKTLSRANGLLSDQFNYNSSYKDSKGNLYFGSVKGMVRFNPSKFPKTHHHVPVYITGLQIHNKEVEINKESSPLDSAITFTHSLSLKHDQSTFSIDFSALSYVAPSMTEYAYKMEGVDKEWIRLKTNRKVYFTNLTPGKYTFKVNTVDVSGNFKGKGAQLFIEVLPPFWASTTAYLAYLTLIILTIYLLIKSYDGQIKERNRRRLANIQHQRERSLYQAKINFFTLIVHEIRTPLTLIKAPLEKAIQNTKPNSKIKKHLGLIEKNTDRLITLSGQLLDFRRVENHSFRLAFKKMNISALIEETYKNFQLSSGRKEQLFSLVIPEKPIYIEVDEEAFVKIISNLLDNATKYGRHIIKVQIEEKRTEGSSCVQITVINDGKIIPKQLRKKIFEPFYRIKEETHKQGTGLGLALSYSLAKLLSGTLELKITEEKFNAFILTLPLIQNSSHEKRK